MNASVLASGAGLQSYGGQMNSIRIGLIRHFEVLKPMPRGWFTWGELAAWREEYERTEIIAR